MKFILKRSVCDIYRIICTEELKKYGDLMSVNKLQAEKRTKSNRLREKKLNFVSSELDSRFSDNIFSFL